VRGNRALVQIEHRRDFLIAKPGEKFQCNDFLATRRQRDDERKKMGEIFTLYQRLIGRECIARNIGNFIQRNLLVDLLLTIKLIDLIVRDAK
jgi:hypothetical protein